MKITKITTLISFLVVGLFLNLGCSSKMKRTETVSSPQTPTRTERTETTATTQPTESRETTNADLGATSAGRSR